MRIGISLNRPPLQADTSPVRSVAPPVRVGNEFGYSSKTAPGVIPPSFARSQGWGTEPGLFTLKVFMPVTLLCPNLTCRAVLQVPDRVRGKQIRCGKCGVCFVVPGTPARPRPNPPASPAPPK